jgi:hypothetical protein
MACSDFNKHEYIISLHIIVLRKLKVNSFVNWGEKEKEHCSPYIWAFHYLLGITGLTDSYTEI